MSLRPIDAETGLPKRNDQLTDVEARDIKTQLEKEIGDAAANGRPLTADESAARLATIEGVIADIARRSQRIDSLLTGNLAALRPTYPDSGAPKDFRHVTHAERVALLAALAAEVEKRVSATPPIAVDPSLAELVVRLSAGSRKGDHVHPEVLKAAPAEAKRLLDKPAKPVAV